MRDVLILLAFALAIILFVGGMTWLTIETWLECRETHTFFYCLKTVVMR